MDTPIVEVITALSQGGGIAVGAYVLVQFMRGVVVSYTVVENQRRAHEEQIERLLKRVDNVIDNQAEAANEIVETQKELATTIVTLVSEIRELRLDIQTSLGGSRDAKR